MRHRLVFYMCAYIYIYAIGGQRVNGILHKALSSVNVPSRLEPISLDRADGKHTDGISMVPWSNGRLLVWDATCADPSHLSMTAFELCAAVNQAEQTKTKKYI